MTARPPHPPPCRPVRRVADVQLRGRTGPVATRVFWPAGPGAVAAPALLVLLPDGGGTAGGVERPDVLARHLCARVGAVVLAVVHRSGPGGRAALRDATTATHWAADHAVELGADPRRLLVAGAGTGGGLAAALARHARDEGWPPIARHVLICPDLVAGRAEAVRPDAASVDGVAPATVVTVGRDPHGDDGGRYAARLRHAGVEVDELRYDAPPHGDLWVPWGGTADRIVGDLARSLRRTVAVTPAPPGPGPHGDAVA